MNNMEGLRLIDGVSFERVASWLSEQRPTYKVEQAKDAKGTHLSLDRIVKLDATRKADFKQAFGDPISTAFEGEVYTAAYEPDGSLPIGELTRTYGLSEGRVIETTYIKYVRLGDVDFIIF